MGQTFIEKIVQQFADGIADDQIVHSGDFVSIQPAHVMTHDNTGAIMPKFREIGAKQLYNPGQVVVTLDHNVQDTSEKNLQKYSNIEAFARSMGAHFYPAGRGIGHQVMCEEGFAWPGTMVVASDSHSNMYGGLGAWVRQSCGPTQQPSGQRAGPGGRSRPWSGWNSPDGSIPESAARM